MKLFPSRLEGEVDFLSFLRSHTYEAKQSGNHGSGIENPQGSQKGGQHFCGLIYRVYIAKTYCGQAGETEINILGEITFVPLKFYIPTQ